MSEQIFVNKSLSKAEKYKSLLPQISALVAEEKNLTTNLAQITAALKYSMDDFLWVGFYLREGDKLVLGPFQGNVACSSIIIPNGVCGAAIIQKKTIVVDDVNNFSGHIACSKESKSEIVVPIFVNSACVAVLDIDSDSYSKFDGTDKDYLEQVAEIVSQLMKK